VFSFGDAHFLGSAVSTHLAHPVVSMAVTSAGAGYWLAAADGGVFASGAARYLGGASTLGLVEPVVGMAVRPG
jgi:hypothetical protein